MARCIRVAVYVWWLLAFATFCSAQEDASAFAGTWQGLIQTDASYRLAGDFADNALTPGEFRIRVSDDGEPTVRFRRRRASWLNLYWPFALIASGDTAVLIGQHRSAYWIESVSFNMTKVDENTLLVYWWRVVNNTQIHPDDPQARFAIGGYGELTRTGRRRR